MNQSLRGKNEMGKDTIGQRVTEIETDPVCNCKETCEYDCKGACGCQACRMAYHDFLTMDFD